MINVNIENLLESVAEGLHKIGCTVEKRKKIMKLLTDVEVLTLLKKKLTLHQKLAGLTPASSSTIDDSTIAQNLDFTKRLDKLEKEHKLGLDHKPLVFDVSYPKSIKENPDKVHS